LETVGILTHSTRNSIAFSRSSGVSLKSIL
jgi:hypothetical protein